MIIENEEATVIAPWKKAGLILLILSEVGLTPFLAEAVSETCDIISLLSTQQPAPDLVKSLVGYGLALPYVVAAMLSVGDLDTTIKKLTARDVETHNVNIALKSFQQLFIGLGFLVGSGAAALGVVDRWGKSPEFYALAGFTLLGQVCVVLLQANKRISLSAQMIEAFLRAKKIELLKNLCHRQMGSAIFNSLINSMYWGAFYYYISADLTKVFTLPYETQSIVAPIFAFLGAYMSLCTQGLQEIKVAHNQLMSPTDDKRVEISQIQNPTWMSLSITSLSFLCRVLATASFVYSVLTENVESTNSFNQTASIIALCMMIPGSFSALQYTKYIHNQVNDALSSIGSFFSQSRFCLFNRKTDAEKPLLAVTVDSDQVSDTSPTNRHISNN